MDQLSDTNQQVLWKLAKKYPLPDFVKNSTPLTSTETLGYSVFADPTGRQFPCVNPAETYISYMYFLNNPDDVPAEKRASVKNRLDFFANYWNIDNDVKQLVDAFEKQNAPAQLSDSDFALSVTYNGKTVRRFPIPNKESVEKAAQYLMDNRAAYPYAWRKQAAENILRKARELSVELPKNLEIYLERAAGKGIAPAIKIASALCYRACMLRTMPEMREVQAKLAKIARDLLDTQDPVPADKLEKIASIIDAVDTRLNWNRFYKEGLATPEEICWGFSLKVADAIKSAHVRLTTGSLYKISDILNTPRKVFDAALPNTVVSEFFTGDRIDSTKVAAVLPTLTQKDASVLEKALSSIGIASVGHDRVNFDADRWDNASGQD